METCTAVEDYHLDRSRHSGVILDLGANVGDTSILLHRLNPDARIVALEPVNATYWYLRWNLDQNNVPLLGSRDFARGAPPRGGVLPIHAGATSDGRTIRFAFDAAFSKNAKQPPARGGQAHSSLTVATRNITDLLVSLTGEQRPGLSLLKVDCEGCEYEVLPALAKGGLLDLVPRIIGELHARQIV